MVDRARPIVWTEDADAGGDRRFLDRLQRGAVTRVTGLRWSNVWPGGDDVFSASLTAPTDLDNAGVRAGRRVYIHAGGATRWSGFLDEPVRGQPWQIAGTGLASMANDWAAYKASGTTINDAVDGAIARGLPWSRPNSLDTTSIANLANGSMTLDQALDQIGKALGKAWALSADGVVSFAAPPTDVDHILFASEPLNPVLTGFTQAVGYYQSGTSSHAVVTTSDSDAQARWGKREGLYDMTALGTLSSTTATTYLQNWLKQNLAAWRYSNPLHVSHGQLRNPGGGPVDLATVRAGCLVRIANVDPSHQTLKTPADPLAVLIGGVEYDADNDTMTMSPIGMRGQDLASVIYQAAGGAL